MISSPTAPSSLSAPAPSTDSMEAVARLRHLVHKNSTRLRCVTLLEALGLAVSAPLAYLWLIFFLDSRLHLSLIGRVLASMGLLGGIAWAVALLVRRWGALRLTDDQVALTIERRTPGGVQNRLINAMQLSRTGASLSAAVVEENYQVLRQVHLEQAARVRPALLRLGLALGLIGVGLGFWLWQPAQFTNAAARILLPLASIDPLYRTTLSVEPGDTEAAGDVSIRVTIHGERPESLTIWKVIQGKRNAERVPVEPGEEAVTFTFHGVAQNLEYAVQGGDFTTPYYRITVPGTAAFSRLRVTYHYPEYTGLPEKTLESPSGDLEALQGTRARLLFTFEQPVDGVTLSLNRMATQPDDRQALERVGDREFAGEVVLKEVLSYGLEISRGDRPAWHSGPHAVRILKDQDPKLELEGLERGAEVAVDATLPLRIRAVDDYGLDKIGLFYRPPISPGEKPRSADEGWREVAVWPAERQTSFRQTFDLPVGSLQAAEGDRLELALRAIDTDPLKKQAWVKGPIFELTVGGEGVALQLQYERLLRGEEELKTLLRSQRILLGELVSWLRKLDGDGGLRWDDTKNVDALHAAIKKLREREEQLRQTAGQTARAMLPQSGNVRIALSMLADTEMVRTQRIFDSVAGREQISAKRAALADARVTQERILRSLEEIQEQYASFRADWELRNMIPFARMLADRQAKMRDQSQRFVEHGAGRAEEPNRLSMSRRQHKVGELCRLIRPTFSGVAERLKEQEPDVAREFTSGAATLGSEELQRPLRQAAEAARGGRWSETAQQQNTAAKILDGLHGRLRAAQAEAARKALAALKEKMKSSLEAQKELEKLAPGTGQAFVKDFPDNLKLEDVVRIREVAGAGKKFGAREKSDKDNELDKSLLDIDTNKIDLKKDSGVRQDPNLLSLANKPMNMGQPKLPLTGRNKVKPFIQEKFADLVGKLLDEAEELTKDYTTLTLTTNQNNNDPGDVGKVGGRLSSTAAGAATGNQKPPEISSGGVSRTGRQGARAHGMVADNEGFNRRGRDNVQEGQEQVADQTGQIKMKNTEDMQREASTGIGGKKVASDDTHFSLSDAGKWKDDMAGRMDKPQRKNSIVERRGEKMDPRVAAQLRDLTSRQEQVIERIQRIKKELRNLYLPTEHLDELTAALQANLESLKDRPDVELFRLQMQTLQKLQSAARVFRGAGAGLQPSLPRERLLRGRVLDGPAPPTLPGYEDAVKDYYQRLANQ